MSIFLDSELTEAERTEDARFHVIPVPLERTVSYGSGTKDGPAAIIDARTSWSACARVLSPAPTASSPNRLWTATAPCPR